MRDADFRESSGQTMGTISTIGFGVGIVGIGVGTVLLLMNGSKSGTTAAATSPLRVRLGSARIEPTFSVDRAGLSGSF